MNDAIKIMLEILAWILSVSYPETTIILWKETGKSLLITLLTIEFISALSVLASYEIFSGILWFLKKFLRINSFPFLKKGKKQICRETWRTKIKTNVVSRTKEIVEKSRKSAYFIYLILFVLNCIPIIPYITTGTVVAVKIFQIRGGIFVVLIGNAVKILLFTMFVFKLM